MIGHFKLFISTLSAILATVVLLLENLKKTTNIQFYLWVDFLYQVFIIDIAILLLLFLAWDYIYKSLFGHDLIKKIAVTVELSKGFPPKNPFQYSAPMTYHYLSYSLSAFFYNLTNRTTNIQDILSMQIILHYFILFLELD